MNKSFLIKSFLLSLIISIISISTYSRSIFLEGLNRLNVDDIQNLTSDDIYSIKLMIIF